MKIFTEILFVQERSQSAMRAKLPKKIRGSNALPVIADRVLGGCLLAY